MSFIISLSLLGFSWVFLRFFSELQGSSIYVRGSSKLLFVGLDAIDMRKIGFQMFRDQNIKECEMK